METIDVVLVLAISLCSLIFNIRCLVQLKSVRERQILIKEYLEHIFRQHLNCRCSDPDYKETKKSDPIYTAGVTKNTLNDILPNGLPSGCTTTAESLPHEPVITKGNNWKSMNKAFSSTKPSKEDDYD